jgi:glucose/arabinose dehydrogenase
VRVDRTTGDGLPDNPLAASPDANARRIIAHGLRNPFRFTFRPGTDELWIGDVGFVRWEEVNVAPDATPERPYNFGWPCFEGPTRNVVWDAVGNAACEDLYADAQGVDFPHFAFGRDRLVDEPCPAGSAALSALAFYDGAAFPDAYRDALFLADHAQACLWIMPAGADGLPDPARIRAFATGVRIPDLIVGSDGALYYVSAVAGQLHRISWRG